MTENQLQNLLLESIASGDAITAKSIAKKMTSNNERKGKFVEWLKKLTSIFEVHLTVKLFGITIIDYKIPKQ